MVFIETRMFTKLLQNYLSDDDYRGLQSYLLQKPDAGDIVRGSGGIRNYARLQPEKAKVEVFVLFIIGKNQIMKFGCSHFIASQKEQQYLVTS